MAKRIEMESVDSSSIDEIGWDEETQELRILFKNSGSLWAYDDFPEAKYRAMLKAPSIGRFFNQEIRGVFSGRRIN